MLDLAQGSEGRRLFLTRQGIGFDPATGRLLDAGEVLAVLAPARARLEDQVFGELLPWPEVEPLFPTGATAELRDVESRLSLRVHRHRGDAHFDVEPLTAADSRTLYEIYGGRWSWKRRAAVLSAGGRRIAASMNGMPHGWGDIADNDFPGHFCVHVSGSRVHTTWRVDTGHQLMVLKAAGRLAETLETAEPRQLVDLVLAALNHAETATLRFTLDEGGLTGGAPDGLLADLLAEIRHLTVTGLEVARAGETEATVRASVTVYFHQPDPGAAFPHTLHVRLTRPSAAAAWSVELASLAPLLDRNRPGRSAALPAVPGTVQPPPPSEGAKPGEEERQCLPDGVLGRCVRGRRRGIGGRPPCWRSCCWQGGADRR